MSSGDDIYKRAVKAMETISGTRHCSHCWMTKTIGGGQWKVSANGLSRRWRCAECTQRAQNRAATTAGTVDPSMDIGSGAKPSKSR